MGGAVPDYSHMYRELNQVSARMRLDHMEFSEVMVIHRMFIRLPDLDLALQEGAQQVKRLYVFADVVELPEMSTSSTVSETVTLRLPGSVMVVILCRVLFYQGFARYDLDFPHMRLHAVQYPPSGAGAVLRMHRRNPDSMQYDDYPVVCVLADVVEFTRSRPNRLFRIGPLAYPSMIYTDKRFSPDSEPWQIPSFYCTIAFPWSSSNNIGPNSVGIGCAFHLSSGATINTVSPREDFWLFRRDLPDALFQDSSILPCMQTSMLVAELVEFCHPSPDVRAAIRSHAEWLNTLLLQASVASEGTPHHSDYNALLFRSQYVIKGVGKSRGAVVPQLQYDMYSNLVNQVARAADSYDQSLKQLQLFIAQNEILGEYLLEQNRVFAAKERDMEVFHSELISQKETELRTVVAKIDLLSLQMEAQVADMEQAREDMEAGLRRFRNRQVANAMFSVFRAIAAVALTVVTGGAAAPLAMSTAKGAVSAAGQAARGLERVLQILDDLQAAMELLKIIKDLLESLQAVGQLVDAPDMPEMPTEADWAIFVNEIEGVAEQMPEEVSEVSAWKTSSKNVAAVGRELMTTTAYMSQLQYDIQVQAMLQDIASKQADRLSSTQAADLSSFTEMVTQMDMRTIRLQVELIKVLDVQNVALMYQSLVKPELMNAWPVTMEMVWRLLIQHEHAAVLGLMRLGPSFDFRKTLTVKDIPVDLLLHGEDWEFEIPVDDFTVFPATWSRVRIHHLEMKFAGGDEAAPAGITAQGAHQPATKSGEIYILLQSSRVFHDRNKTEPLHYEAGVPLDYHYAYNLESGETTLSNLPSYDFIRAFMRMTPFTTWRLRVSASAQENEGLAFPTATLGTGDTTQIAITFHVSAIREIAL